MDPFKTMALSSRSGLGRLVAEKILLCFGPAFAHPGAQRHGNIPIGGTNGEIWKSGKQVSAVRDASQKARNSAFRKRRQGRNSQEQKAGDRDWAF